MTVAELARTDVVTAEPGMPVNELAALMADRRVGSVVVVEDGDLVGIVTDRDLALDVLGVGADPAECSARDVMTAGPFTVEADDGLFDVLAKMCDASVRRVPVLEDGALVGIVTLDDFLVLLSHELRNLAGIIEAESPPYVEPTA